MIEPPSSDGGRGCVEFLLPFERLEFAYVDLVKLGGAVEVRAPRELRERLAQTGRELVARYPISDDAPDGLSTRAGSGDDAAANPDVHESTQRR